jgi:hypothetical protein
MKSSSFKKELKARVLGLAAIERSWCRQASCLIWLKEGDACTRFRSQKNSIPYLIDESGTLAWAHKDKEAILHSHFQNILGTIERRQVTLD